jgi:hypothetical protein
MSLAVLGLIQVGWVGLRVRHHICRSTHSTAHLPRNSPAVQHRRMISKRLASGASGGSGWARWWVRS